MLVFPCGVGYRCIYYESLCLGFGTSCIFDPGIRKMANEAQCYYCFECLSASYGGNEPISLPSVEDLWEQHEQVKELATLQSTGESASFSTREDDDPNQQIIEEYDSEGDEGNGASKAEKKHRPHAIKLPSIGRLQSQMSSDSSSAATTPSSQSVSSSSTAMTTPNSDAADTRQQRQSEQRYPLFVTWNTVSKSGNKSLRGCIGTFEAHELSEIGRAHV